MHFNVRVCRRNGDAVVKVKVGVIGGSGYTGLELLRLLLSHPAVEIEAVTSRRHKGKRVDEVNPHLKPFADIEYEDVSVREIARRCDVVFTAVPHGVAMDYVPELLENGVKVIDLSADYRLSCEEYERIYKKRHKDEQFKEGRRTAVYGLTELHAEEIKNAELVANPGCYPTGAILAVAPLVRARKVKCIVFDAKSGISGGGVEPSQRSHFPNLAENIIPYEVTTHRHTAEIRKELKVSVYFTPHVIPAIRGILTTAHVFLRESISEGEIGEIYRQFYEGKKFIRILNEVPSLQNVRGTNFCDIWFEVERGASVGEVSDVGKGGDVGRADKVEEVKEVRGEREVGKSSRVVVISAIDNLVKGGAGQAIQNMNVMFNLREETGLWFPALVP